MPFGLGKKPTPTQQIKQVGPDGRPINVQTQATQQQELMHANHNSNSTQNALKVAEIRDGIIIMNDGTYRAVVMAKAINFDLMSPEEREATEFAYQGFLNSLYFPLQIFIRSKKIEMQGYLNKLNLAKQSQENMLLALLMEDYMFFIEDLVSQSNIMDKQFYVVIPFNGEGNIQNISEAGKGVFDGIKKIFTVNDKQEFVTINEADLSKAKQELKNRVQSVLNGLLQMGVSAIPLDTEELIDLFYSAYHPGSSRRQGISKDTGINTPVIRKGQGESPYVGGDI